MAKLCKHILFRYVLFWLNTNIIYIPPSRLFYRQLGDITIANASDTLQWCCHDAYCKINIKSASKNDDAAKTKPRAYFMGIWNL